MTILEKGEIYKQWFLTILLGSLVYTIFGGAANMERMMHNLTVFEKLRLYAGCFVLTLFYSFITAGLALYLNRIIYSLISCQSSIKNKLNWVAFLLFPALVSTAIYCIIFSLLPHGEGSYSSLMLRAARFLLPWIGSSVFVTILLNKQMPSAEKIAGQGNQIS